MAYAPVGTPRYSAPRLRCATTTPTHRALTDAVRERTAPRIQSLAALCDNASSQARDVTVHAAVARCPGGATTTHAFRCAVRAAADLVTRIPSQRWTLIEADGGADAHGGFLRHVQRLDATAFRLSAAETASLDPQQRVLLEGGIEAVSAVGSGVHVDATGVFVGCTFWAFEEVVLADARLRDAPLAATGSGLSLLSGRLSFTLGATGPCWTVDTACSAALAGAPPRGGVACRRGGRVWRGPALWWPPST